MNPNQTAGFIECWTIFVAIAFAVFFPLDGFYKADETY
jgi:hypothetical protein